MTPLATTVELDAVLEALADPTRRDIFERLVIRPRRVGELAGDLPVTRPAVSHHIRVLREAGLVRDRDGSIQAVAEALPIVRLYFDRLWLEASLGDAWLARRRLETRDFGL
ncbi:MAG: metalloregulator ArsR/SmtB family transcription factor [Pseudomonadota bacterium]|nr:metalloregulator ArsR/SmtB family transcription factor [Pseudomonadota bacterium]